MNIITMFEAKYNVGSNLYTVFAVIITPQNIKPNPVSIGILITLHKINSLLCSFIYSHLRFLSTLWSTFQIKNTITITIKGTENAVNIWVCCSLITSGVAIVSISS